MDFSGLPEGSLAVMDNQAKFDELSERYRGTKAVVPKLDSELTAKLQKTATVQNAKKGNRRLNRGRFLPGRFIWWRFLRAVVRRGRLAGGGSLFRQCRAG